MQCCAPAKWKREEISDHKFDYVDVDDFVEESVPLRFSYMLVFGYTLKSILVYMADLGVLVLMIATNALSSLFADADQSQRQQSQNPQAPTIATPTANTLVCNISAEPRTGLAQWVSDNPKFTIISIAASIALSFVLLAIEWRKAMTIIRSRDISYAFTSTIAYRYYAIRSYAHFCFFSQIQNSRKTTDLLAFFVFFRFKGWMRLLLAEFPRQFINAINIYSALSSCLDLKDQNDFFLVNYAKSYGKAMTSPIDGTKKALLVLATVTVTIWLLSAISLLIAFFLYIPLLCTIRGNLKEYCVHKIDKRIGELLRRKSRKRLQEARKAEMREIEANRLRQANVGGAGSGGGSSTSGSVVGKPRPTLPDMDVDLDNQYQGYAPSTRSYAPAPSTYGVAESASVPTMAVAAAPPSLHSGYAGSVYGVQTGQPAPPMPMMPSQFVYASASGPPSMYGHSQEYTPAAQYAQQYQYANQQYASSAVYTGGRNDYAGSDYGYGSDFDHGAIETNSRLPPQTQYSTARGGPAAMATEGAYGVSTAQYPPSNASRYSQNDMTMSTTPLVSRQSPSLPPSQPMQRMQGSQRD